MGGIAHFLDVVGAYAFLHIDKPGTGRVRLAHQIRHERMHPGGGEQHAGVIFRYNGRARDYRMSALGKEFQILGTKFIAVDMHLSRRQSGIHVASLSELCLEFRNW